MKAERRHELRENDLVHALTAARDYLEENGSRLGLIAVGVIIVIAVALAYTKSRAAAMEDVWKRRGQLKFTELEEGRKSLEILRELTVGVSDRTFVMDSLMDQGRQALSLAQAVPDPPGPELNEFARRAFEELLAEFPDNPVAVGVGRLGLVTVEQNAFVIDGDLGHKETARDLLTSIIQDDRLDGLPVQTVAIQRRESLDESFTRVTLVSVEPNDPPAADEAPTDEGAEAPAAVDVP
jgi:hypothetical protein